MKKKRVLRESDDKIVNIRNKSIRRKKQRRITIGVILLLIGTFLALLLLPCFNIKYIDVEGQSKVTQRLIYETSQIQYGTNIFKLNVKKLKSRTESIPYVQEVKIKRKIPNVVIFEIEERTPVAALQAGKSYVLIDMEGRFLENVKETKLPVIEGLKVKMEIGKFLGEQTATFGDKFKHLYQLLEKNDLCKRVTKYIVDKKENITFEIDGTKTIVIGEEKNIEYKFKMLEAAINELPPTQKGTIDLSEEGKALYTPHE